MNPPADPRPWVVLAADRLKPGRPHKMLRADPDEARRVKLLTEDPALARRFASEADAGLWLAVSFPEGDPWRARYRFVPTTL